MPKYQTIEEILKYPLKIIENTFTENQIGYLIWKANGKRTATIDIYKYKTKNSTNLFNTASVVRNIENAYKNSKFKYLGLLEKEHQAKIEETIKNSFTLSQKMIDDLLCQKSSK